ncbi:MAG TPA: site-specific integrase [Acidimicrobiales bacterium]|nr:site-specific integrase [Acidimicrobiales bacterium]
MAGSLRRRGDRGPDVWELRVFLGRDARGRVRHRSRLFRGSKRAAEKELARLVLAQDERPEVVPDEASRTWGPTTTVNDAIAGWEANGWDDLSPVTARRYENIWKVHIADAIGTRRIASLSPYDVEQYFRRLKAKGAGRETVRYVRSVLHRACRLARKWSGNQLHNPVTDTELPSWGLDDRPGPVRAPTVEEVRAVIAATAGQDLRYAVALRVLAATGMRRGEACALRWSDVDWEGATLTVDEAVVSAHGGAVVKAPKTRASIRRLAVDPSTLHDLRTLHETQRTLATACGTTLDDDGFVFSSAPGGEVPPFPDTFSRAFSKARKAAGLPADLHLHSLRHFQATSIDTVVPERQKQARLGWSTVHMARHYTDALSSEDRRAANHIGALLDGEAQGPPPDAPAAGASGTGTQRGADGSSPASRRSTATRGT